jgi:uncharacterized protein (TIRG00374 family)
MERHKKALFFSIILTSFIYLAGVLYVGWNNVLNNILGIGIGSFLLILSLSLINYGFRFIRWKYYLSVMGFNIPTNINLNIYLSGFAFTTTPGKAGELVRSFLLKREGISYPVSIAAFLSDRASDLISLLFLLLLTYTNGVNNYYALLVSIFFGVILFISIFLFARTNLIKFIHKWAVSKKYVKLSKFTDFSSIILENFRKCTSGYMLALSLVLGLFAWTAEGIGFYLIIHFTSDIGPDLFQAIFIYTLATLIGAISLLPAGIGTTEAVLFSSLVYFDVGYSESVSITILARVVTLWFGVAVGLMSMLFHGKYKNLQN